MSKRSIVVLVGLVVAAHFIGQLFALGCSENVDPGTTWADTCDAVGRMWSATWWLAVLWPAFLFLASQLIPPLRRYPVAAGGALALLMVAFWTPLLLIVSGNLG